MVYDPFEKYGLRRTINAATSLTTLGGSMPDPSVFDAMLDASKAFIYIPQLQDWAGKRLASAFGAEAGLPTAGAVNSLMLACAACMMRGSDLEGFDPLVLGDWNHLIQRLPMHTGYLRNEFIVMGDSRSEYDHAIEAAGGKRVQAGDKDGVSADDMEAAYSEKTGAYYYTLFAFKDQFPLEEFVKIAHSHDVPVIVDAAPCLTHKAVPKKLLSSGADMIIFSGGKQFGGPNNSGILLGRKDLIKLAHLQAYPFDGIGRAAKMSRETIVGLIAALEVFMDRDDDTYYRGLQKETREFSEMLDAVDGIRAGVLNETSIADDVVPPSYAWIEMDGGKVSLRALYEGLFYGEPCIRALFEPFFITNEAANRVTFKVEYLLPGDKEVILGRIREILG